MDKIRKAQVAGQFYPSSARQLKSQIASFVKEDKIKAKAIGCILPHAGYVYSGRVACQTVSCLEVSKRIVLLGPNHTGMGEPFSIMPSGAWQTPLGQVKIDSGLAGSILKRSQLFRQDLLAHSQEHSLEVELPILQYFRSDIEIVPISFLSDNLDLLRQAGAQIASAIKEDTAPDQILLIASSDMTHYEPLSAAEKKDAAAIEAILALDEDKLMQAIQRFDITMCGYAPVVVMLTAAKLLGANKAKLVKYETSAAASGDTSSVVGYAGIIVY